jgi:hypothetical protein
MFDLGGFLAAAAAQEQRRLMYEEEERMTKYSPDELREDWEFKIVRAETPIFRKPEIFQLLLQEEAISGWQLVEKLDDMRVRFKRSPSARKRDAMLPQGVDPYRTRFGSYTRSARLLIVNIVLLVAVGLGMFLLYDRGSIAATALLTVILPLLVIIGVLALIISRVRKGR